MKAGWYTALSIGILFGVALDRVLMKLKEEQLKKYRAGSS